MHRLWSISTTVRNPLRLREFLRVLASMEGLPFNTENQIAYQILLIKNRLYKPMDLTPLEIELFKNPEREFTLVAARTIFERQQYQDPDMRGRQSANPLNKLGFAVARSGAGNIQITELGRHFLDNSEPIEEVFLRSLLKLQFPNPWTDEFTATNGFNVRPLVATLRLLISIEERFGAGGLTSSEFSLLVPSLINHERIALYLNTLQHYRESQNKDGFIREFGREFYGHEPNAKEISNFFEYGDNIMRYFRMTRLFRVTRSGFGAEWRIGLESLRMGEIRKILETQTPEATVFATQEAYLNYLADFNQPELSLSDRPVLLDRIQNIKDYLARHLTAVSTTTRERVEAFISIVVGQDTNLGEVTEQGRTLITEVENEKQKSQLRHNLVKLREIITTLSDARLLRRLEPEEFEFLVAQALLILNDEELIKPNYLTDDVGQPIEHASGNRADIEGYYASFNCIVEVTKDSSSFQWVRESAPVMRHLRDFERNHTGKEAFCLFIAPRVHTDTAHQFWIANQHGYDGQVQRVAPLTTNQFVDILNAYLSVFERGTFPGHGFLKSLLERLSVPVPAGHTAWIDSISNTVQMWSTTL